MGSLLLSGNKQGPGGRQRILGYFVGTPWAWVAPPSALERIPQELLSHRFFLGSQVG